MELKDMNDDGSLDLATIISPGGNRQLRLYRGNGDGTFSSFITVDTGDTPPSGFPDALAIDDVNGDGIPDFVIHAIGNIDTHIGSILGKGDGTFDSPILSPTPFGGTSIQLADFDLDGVVDVMDHENSNSIHLGIGDGTFANGRDYWAGHAPQGIRVAIGDLDGDGNLDTATASQQDGRIFIQLNRR